MRLEEVAAALECSTEGDWHSPTVNAHHNPIAFWGTDARGQHRAFEYEHYLVMKSDVSVSIGVTSIGPMPTRESWMNFSEFPVLDAIWSLLDVRYQGTLIDQSQFIEIRGQERDSWSLPEPRPAGGKPYDYYIQSCWLAYWEAFLFDILRVGRTDCTPSNPREFYDQCGVRILDS